MQLNYAYQVLVSSLEERGRYDPEDFDRRALDSGRQLDCVVTPNKRQGLYQAALA
jgi:hypothetical protein